MIPVISKLKKLSKRVNGFAMASQEVTVRNFWLWENFISSSSQKRKLKNGACSSVFSWTSQTQESSLPSKKKEKEILEAEITDTASEGEGRFDETD